jgi:hypothetical protein
MIIISGGIATGYKLDGQGLFPGRGIIFLLSTAARPVLAASKASYPMSIWVSLPGGEASGT